MSSVLVTGGAGYIGSVTVDLLEERGEHVVVLDDLSAGHRSAVDDAVPLYEGDVADRLLVSRIVRDEGVTACIHFAGLIAVGESVRDPSPYMNVNVAGSIALLDVLRAEGVSQLVFSSSAAVYGTPDTVPITEQQRSAPTSPYGRTKVMTEQVLADYDAAYGLRYVALRYFNAAGATDQRAERHDPETHLIPNVLRAASGRTGPVMVFGDDYPTEDGTAVRDYVHVHDLAAAHLLALDYLRDGGPSEVLNLGAGRGHSVLEVIRVVEGVTARSVPVQIAGRRAGDPPVLVADASGARSVLGWEPQRSALDAIISDAWAHGIEAPPDDPSR